MTRRVPIPPSLSLLVAMAVAPFFADAAPAWRESTDEARAETARDAARCATPQPGSCGSPTGS